MTSPSSSSSSLVDAAVLQEVACIHPTASGTLPRNIDALFASSSWPQLVGVCRRSTKCLRSVTRIRVNSSFPVLSNALAAKVQTDLFSLTSHGRRRGDRARRRLSLARSPSGLRLCASAHWCIDLALLATACRVRVIGFLNVLKMICLVRSIRRAQCKEDERLISEIGSVDSRLALSNCRNTHSLGALRATASNAAAPPLRIVDARPKARIERCLWFSLPTRFLFAATGQRRCQSTQGRRLRGLQRQRARV